MRSNGILCGITSLPSKYGVGDLGYPSYEFSKRLKEAGIKYWQLLPLNPVDGSNSPYASSCDSAIDEIYISLDLLKEEGLLKNIKKEKFEEKYVDYKHVRTFKNYYLHKAFKLQKDTESAGFLKFLEENTWLRKYAMFMVLSEKNNYQLPHTWPKKDKNAFYSGRAFSKADEQKISYYCWVQYKLFQQLDILKEHLKEDGVILIGDMPYYVGLNSSDFISHLDNFSLNEDDSPKFAGGVPPDYFSPEGQLWGNPVYDIDFMRQDNYAFFLNRIRKALKKYDILRLDHFRAFDTYYEIPAEAKNAIGGKWRNGLGHEFFELLSKEGFLDRIIVEDLGDVFPSVYRLRDDFKLPGMNIIQFTMFDNKFKYIENQVIYTGTHDNETIVGFYKNMPAEEKAMLDIKFRYAGVKNNLKVNYKFIDFAFKQEAYLAIIPLQDYLGLDNRSRMNTPGLNDPKANWTFKISDFADFDRAIPKIKKLIESNNR